MNLRFLTLSTALTSSLFLNGCITTEADSSSDNKDASLPSFTLSTYQDQSDNLSTDNIMGTWVAIHNFNSTIGSAIDAGSTASEIGSAVEVFVITENDDAELYMASCLGGFNKLIATDNELTAGDRVFSKIDNKRMSTMERRPSQMSSFANYPLTSIQALKISNSTDPIGTITWSWSDESSDNESLISCFYKENINGISGDQSKWVSEGIKAGGQHTGMTATTRLTPSLSFCSKTANSQLSKCLAFGGVFDSNDGVYLSIDAETESTFSTSFTASDYSTGTVVDGSIQIAIPSI